MSVFSPRKPPPEAEIERPARPALQPAPDIRFVLKGFRIAGATVFRERPFVMTRIEREFLPVADGPQARGGDPQRDKVGARGHRAARR